MGERHPLFDEDDATDEAPETEATEPVETEEPQEGADAEADDAAAGEGEDDAAETGDDTATPADASGTGRRIPLPAYLDEREKRQTAQRLLEEERAQRADLQKRLEALEAKRAHEGVPSYDGGTPQGQAMRETLFNEYILPTSLARAKAEFGEAKLAEAFAFFEDNPHLSEPLRRSADPWGDAVRYVEREKARAEIGDDPGAYRSRLEAELREKLRAELAAEQAQAAPAPVHPKTRPLVSLAGAPAARAAPRTAAGDDPTGMFG